MSIISIQGLSKSYGKIQALQNLSLDIPQGSAYGILGPNGSGKTTLLGSLLQIIQPDAGTFSWNIPGYESNPRMGIGALLETPNFYPYLNAVENLTITAKIKETKGDDIQELLETVGLWKRKKSRFSSYSLGMKQRLAIAAAMLGNPSVLIFDEPTNGLDPQGIAEIRVLIQNIASMGKTVIMASHILDEVEKICTHVAIIHNGVKLEDGLVGNILKDQIIIEIASETHPDLQAIFSECSWVTRIEKQNNVFVLAIESHMNPADVNKFAIEKGVVLSHLYQRKKRLEEEFLQIIKRNV
ncbi:MAG: ATP-binding cassette domain-containing protein [Saprospiraceae bacterium]|nr:ATP-binding cassette domain-containing protein [Saprospiraceae bacterium]